MAGKGKVGDGASEQDDHDLAKEEEEVDHTVQHDHPHQVPHQQVEGVLGGCAEVCALRRRNKSDKGGFQ